MGANSGLILWRMSRVDKNGDGGYYIFMSNVKTGWTGASGSVDGVLKLDQNLNWVYYVY